MKFDWELLLFFLLKPILVRVIGAYFGDGFAYSPL
jgi:hypothetical protein